MRRASSRPATTSIGKAQGELGAAHELRGILGHAQGIGADRAHRVPVEAAHALAEPAQTVERTLLRRFVEILVRSQSRRQPHRLAQRIERIDPVVDHLGDLQPKAVGAEVDGGDGGVAGHRSRPRPGSAIQATA